MSEAKELTYADVAEHTSKKVSKSRSPFSQWIYLGTEVS